MNPTADPRSIPAPLRVAAVLLIAFAAFIFIAPAANALPAFGPKSDLRIRQLLYDNNARHPLPDGWTLQSWRFTDFDIFVALDRAPRGRALIRVTNSSLPSTKPLIGQSRNFRLELLSLSNASRRDADPALIAFLNRVRANDSPLFFSAPDMRNPESFEISLFRKHALIPLLSISLLACLVLLALNARALVAELLPSSLPGKLALLALFALALTIRLQLGPQAPIHNNGHGVREIRSVVSPESAEQKEIKYDLVYPLVMRWTTAVGGASDTTIFRANEIFAALAVLAIFFLAKSLLKSDPAAFVAAAFAAFSPARVLLSGTESPVSLFLLAAPLGLALLAVSVRTASRSLLAAAAILIALAASLHLLTVLIVPAAAIIFLMLLIETRPIPPIARPAVLALVLLSAWLILHILAMPPDNIQMGLNRFSPGLFINNMRHGNFLHDPTLTPAPLIVFAAVSFVLCCFFRPAFAAAAALVFLLIVPVSFTAMADRSDIIRYQTPTLWFYELLAAAPLAFLHSSTHKRFAAPLSAIAILLIATFSLYGLSTLRNGDEDAREYRFIHSVAVRLPKNSTILLTARNIAHGNANIEFPDYLRDFKLRRAPKARPGDILYIGLDCYRYGSPREKQTAVLPGGLRRECATACDGRLIDIRQTTLALPFPDKGFHKRYFHIASPRPRIGFHRCLPPQ